MFEFTLLSLILKVPAFIDLLITIINYMIKLSMELSLMRNALIISLSTLVLVACSADVEMEFSTSAPSANEVLADVQAAMGTENLSSLTVSGEAWSVRNGFRQTRKASPPWLYRNEIMDYIWTIDLDNSASLATGETFAHNLFYDTPTFSNFLQSVTSDQNAWTQQHRYWLTPLGFLQGAEDNGASVSMNDDYAVLSWMSPAEQTSPSGMRYTVNAYVNGHNLIEMTETWVEDAFMGDLHVSAMYSDYKEMDGVMVPTTTEIWQGGGAIFGVAIREADANPSNLTDLITPPPVNVGGPGGAPPGGEAPSPADLIKEVAPGVYHIDTNYKSLAVEFEDGFVVFESAGFPANVNAGIIMAAIASVSEKPITAVINSHPHSDHTTSLVPIVRAGIPLIVSENSVGFQRMALSSPRELLGEETLTPEFQTVPDGEVMVIEDSMNRLEIHHIPSLHTDSLLFVYLPNHSLAMQADFTIRGDGNGGTLPYEGQTPLGQEFAEYIRDNGLEFDNMLGVHSSGYIQGTEDVFMALPPEGDM